VFRNLVLTFCILQYFWKWLFNQPDWRCWEPTQTNDNSHIFLHQEFPISHCIVLTDCYVLNHWWLAIAEIFRSNIFSLIDILGDRSSIFIGMLLQIISIWFKKAPRKPPDKREKKTIAKNIHNNLLNGATYIVYIIEDLLFFSFKMNIDLCYWIYIVNNIIYDYAFELLQIILAIEVNNSQVSTSEWKSNHLENNISIFEVNKHDNN
jgi:hypothetical protein